MLRVGLTGGLACGKSTVAQMMADRGAYVVDADKVAHQLMLPGQPVYEQVVRLFGSEIVNQSDGSINRPKLAEIAFGSDRIEELNRIVHPAVIDHQLKWMEEIGARDPHAIAVWEAALIIEADVRGRFDKLVVVTCKPEQKIERYIHRALKSSDGPLAEISARKEAQRRIAAQRPDEEKIKVADFVIDTSGSVANTEKQVDRLMTQLKALA
jgi:dephospho-CoA kinase